MVQHIYEEAEGHADGAAHVVSVGKVWCGVDIRVLGVGACTMQMYDSGQEIPCLFLATLTQYLLSHFVCLPALSQAAHLHGADSLDAAACYQLPPLPPAGSHLEPA